MDPARSWAQLHDLPSRIYRSSQRSICSPNPIDGEPDEPLRSDGYIKPEWLEADFEWTTASPRSLGAARCSGVADVAGCVDLRDSTIGRRQVRSLDRSLPRSCCAPSWRSMVCRWIDRSPRSIVASFVGPRPRTEAEAIEQRRARDAEVLRHSTNPAVRPAQPCAGQVTAPWHRCRTARYPRVALEAIREFTSVDRGVAGMAQGRADGDHVRLRLARRAPRGGRPAAWRVVGLRRRRRAHDRVGRAAQHAGTPAAGCDRRAGPCVRSRRSGADRTAHPRCSLRRCRARRSDSGGRHVPAGGGATRSRSGHREGGRCSVRCTDRRQVTVLWHSVVWNWPIPVAMRYLTEADLAGQVGRDLRTYGGRLVRMGSTSRRRRQRSGQSEPGSRAWSVRAQRDGAGCCRRVLQGVGRDGACPRCGDRCQARALSA